MIAGERNFVPTTKNCGRFRKTAADTEGEKKKDMNKKFHRTEEENVYCTKTPSLPVLPTPQLAVKFRDRGDSRELVRTEGYRSGSKKRQADVRQDLFCVTH